MTSAALTQARPILVSRPTRNKSYTGISCGSSASHLSIMVITLSVIHRPTTPQSSPTVASVSEMYLFSVYEMIKYNRLTNNQPNLLKPNPSNCYTLSYRPNLPFLISDIWALWRSAEICRSRRFSKGVGHFKRKFQFQTDGGVVHQPLLVSKN